MNSLFVISNNVSKKKDARKVMKIPKYIYDDMISHSKSLKPIEACGYLAGTGDEVKKLYRMTNIDQSPEHFSFDPKEQFAVLKEARRDNMELIGVYHSHPESPARLSEEDLKLLKDPRPVYLIVSLMDDQVDVKGFKIDLGNVKLESLEIQ